MVQDCKVSSSSRFSGDWPSKSQQKGYKTYSVFTDIWRGIWLPQHRHVMPIRWWREPCLPSSCHTSSTGPGSHLQKPHRLLRWPKSACQFWQDNILHSLLIHSKMFFQMSPRWLAYKLGSGQRAVPASRPVAEVETDPSPDTPPVWLHHHHSSSLTSFSQAARGWVTNTAASLLFSLPTEIQQWGNLRLEKQLRGCEGVFLTPNWIH